MYCHADVHIVLSTLTYIHARTHACTQLHLHNPLHVHIHEHTHTHTQHIGRKNEREPQSVCMHPCMQFIYSRIFKPVFTACYRSLICPRRYVIIDILLLLPFATQLLQITRPTGLHLHTAILDLFLARIPEGLTLVFQVRFVLEIQLICSLGLAIACSFVSGIFQPGILLDFLLGR